MAQRPLTIAATMGAVVARFTFTRYLLASVCALCSDMALFLALLRMGLHPTLAAFAGYVVGLGLHWLISVRFVFLSSGRGTHGQRLGFVFSAVVGLGITVALVSGFTAVGLAPALAKLLAIPLSFLSVYAIRKYGVFAAA